MAKKRRSRKKMSDYHAHWFVQSVKFTPAKVPNRPRQHSSCAGQLSLPITPRKAERRKPKGANRR
jgi:hypothetical protein